MAWFQAVVTALLPLNDPGPGLKPRTAWAASLILVAIATVGDFVTGPYFVFDLFYLVPILLASWSIGRGAGLFFALICAPLSVAVQIMTGHPLVGPLMWIWTGAMRFGIWALAVWLVSELHLRARRQAALILELQEAMARIKQLTGLLPMCAWCRKLRTEDGDWLRLEEYLEGRTNASVTHGICPDCARVVVSSGKQPPV